jgi:hypothetical protein
MKQLPDDQSAQTVTDVMNNRTLYFFNVGLQRQGILQWRVLQTMVGKSQRVETGMLKPSA